MEHQPNFKMLKIGELGETTVNKFTNSEDDGVGRDIANLGLEVLKTPNLDGVEILISPDKEIAKVQVQRLTEVLEDNFYFHMASSIKLGVIFNQKLQQA